MSLAPDIIGGMFGVAPDCGGGKAQPLFWTEPNIALSSARSGINLLLKSLGPKQIWMPSYLCGAMVEAVENTGSRLCYYKVDQNLNVADDGWLSLIQPGDVAVFIDYFGFPAAGECVEAAKKKGAWVLEDAGQALLSPVNDLADFVLYSPRKFVGVPDGGILTYKASAGLSLRQPELYNEDWIQASLQAGQLRSAFDGGEQGGNWFALFQQAECICPVEPFAMSPLTRELLSGFDYDFIAARRRENYLYLLEQLSDIALFPDFPDTVIPLGFPVRVESRDAIRSVLFEHRIYPPVHWDISDIVPEIYTESHRLSGEIMTLPCDQRYTIEDMERMVQVLLSV